MANTPRNMPSVRKVLKTAKEYTPLVFQIGSVIFLLVSAFIAYTLSPLYESSRDSLLRIEAVEQILQDRQAVVERYIVTESEVSVIKESIKEIKESQVRTEQKLDKLIFTLR